MKTKKSVLLLLLGLVALSGCTPDPSSSSSEPPASSSEPPTSEVSSSGGSSSEVSSGSEGSSSEVEPPVEPKLAAGVKNFATASAEERADLLGVLEKYTLDNFLSGVPYRDNSGYVLYNPRLVIPSDTYVTGYGFGVGESSVTGPLTAEGIIPAHAMYYHSWQQEDPGTINYLDEQDSVSGDLHGMVSSSYWATKFNETKDGYEWYPQLADEVAFPIPLNLDPITGMATKWRVPVKVGGDLKYNTASTVPAVAAFKDRAVVLEDYLTPFKLMVENGWFRSTDIGFGSGAFVGVAAELGKPAAQRDIANVSGIKLNVEEQAIEFEFLVPKTAFYAMYSLSGSLFSPIPFDFIGAIGGAKFYGGANPDSILSLGVYMVEAWEAAKQVVFKKNPTFFEADRYSLEGYVYTILPGGSNVAFSEFLAGKLDSAGVPSTQKSYRTDPRARKTEGDTIWKIQTNGADEELWQELFGPAGKVSPGSEWDLKPVMSNKDFLEGLYFAVDREAIALETGSKPAQAFLSDNYMIDPVEKVSWRSTPQGKAVIEDRLPETFGFSKELAGMYFNSAMDDLVTAKKYVRGTAEAPTKIELKFIFQTVTQVTNEGGPLIAMLEGAFNDAVEGFELDVEGYATSNWMDAYNAPMAGEFDLAFGSISGNALDPINFMETVTSDNRSGFTLSWGVDTSLPSEDVVFKNEIYSFDALLEAGQGFVLVGGGVTTPAAVITDIVISEQEDGSFDIELSGTYYIDPTGEFVVGPDEDGLGGFAGETGMFIEIWLWSADKSTVNYDGLLNIVGGNPETWEDGHWTVIIEGIEFDGTDLWGDPAGDVAIIDVIIGTVSTYGGFAKYQGPTTVHAWDSLLGE